MKLYLSINSVVNIGGERQLRAILNKLSVYKFSIGTFHILSPII